MYYKIIINNYILNYSSLCKILKKLSKFYIIINPTISVNYYIIYLIIDNIDNLYLLNKYKIYGFIYNKIIYKIFYYYLQNYTYINNYLFIDYTFYNLMDIKIYNTLSFDNYLRLYNIHKPLKSNISNLIRCVNNKIIWIIHKNIKYLNFIMNYITNYINNIKPINYIIITDTIDKNKEPNKNNKSSYKNNQVLINLENEINKYKLSNYIMDLKYIIIKLTNSIIDINLIQESINIFYNKLIYQSNTLYKKINHKINILILSNYNDNIYNNYLSYINFYRFSKLI